LWEGHTVDLALITVLYLAQYRERSSALIWVALIGALAGGFGAAWRGSTVASYFLVAFLGSLVSRYLLLESAVAIVVYVWVASLLEGAIHLHFGHWFARIPSPFEGRTTELIVQATLNALVAPLWLLLLAWVDTATGARRRTNSNRLVLDI